MEDIVPELYEKIRKMFDGLVSSDEEIQAILNGDKVGTFAELYPMSKRVGKYAAKSLSNHYTEELLPDGKLYWNIMERTIMPIMKNVHKIDNQLAFNVQKKLDAAQKIGIKPQESDFPEDRVNSVMNMLSTLTNDNKTDLQRASQILTRSVVNISNSIIDNFVQKNAEFRANAGMTAKIIRTSSGHCCEWCNEIAGTYKYPDVPKDVYRRHDNCDCTVEYVVGKIRQDVWTKKTRRETEEIRYEGLPKNWKQETVKEMDEQIRTSLELSNPNFYSGMNEYKENCPNCVCAFEMRMRGYDVEAVKATNNRKLNHHPELAWKKYKIIELRGNGLEGIYQELKKDDDGVRYEVAVLFEKKKGHVFVAIKNKGKVLFYDPQNGKMITENFFNYVVENSTKIWRIDNLELSDRGVTACISRG